MNQHRLEKVMQAAEMIIGGTEGNPLQECLTLIDLQYPEVPSGFARTISKHSWLGPPRQSLAKEVEKAMELIYIYVYGRSKEADVAPFSWLRVRELFLHEVMDRVWVDVKVPQRSNSPGESWKSLTKMVADAQRHKNAMKHVIALAEGMKCFLPDRRLARSSGVHALMLVLQSVSSSLVYKRETPSISDVLLMECIAEEILKEDRDTINWETNAYGFFFGAQEIQNFMKQCLRRKRDMRTQISAAFPCSWKSKYTTIPEQYRIAGTCIDELNALVEDRLLNAELAARAHMEMKKEKRRHALMQSYNDCSHDQEFKTPSSSRSASPSRSSEPNHKKHKNTHTPERNNVMATCSEYADRPVIRLENRGSSPTTRKRLDLSCDHAHHAELDAQMLNMSKAELDAVRRQFEDSRA